MALTIKQNAFALAYIEIGNASEAYRRSFDAGKMAPHSIEVEASRLLQNPEVTLRVEELQAEHRKRTGFRDQYAQARAGASWVFR